MQRDVEGADAGDRTGRLLQRFGKQQDRRLEPDRRPEHRSDRDLSDDRRQQQLDLLWDVLQRQLRLRWSDVHVRLGNAHICREPVQRRRVDLVPPGEGNASESKGCLRFDQQRSRLPVLGERDY